MNSVKYIGTLSSNGKQTTSQTNQVIDLGSVYQSNYPNSPSGLEINATSLTVENFASTSIHIKLNDEPTVHEIDANSSVSFSDITITKFTIQENAVQYRWTALY